MIYILNCFTDKALEKVEFPNEAQIKIESTNDFDLSNLDDKEQNEYIDDNEDEDAKYLFENQQYTFIDDDDEYDRNSENDDLDSNAANDVGIDSFDDFNNEQKIIGQSNRSIANKDGLIDMNIKKPINQSKQSNRPIIRSKIDGREWMNEYEQMLPQLKLANRFLDETGNNWRIRFEELKKRNHLINNEHKKSNDGLNRIELDVQKSLDRLESRERYVQQQMHALCNELLAYRSELNRSMDNYQQINGGVISKSRRLAELNEQIQRVKTETEKREQFINDKAPLIQIKKSLAKLKLEINELNIKIGVGMRNLMYQNHQKTMLKTDLLHNSSNYRKDSFDLIGVSTY